MVQSQGVGMICRLKGEGERGVTEAKGRLQLEQTNVRLENSIKLLHEILSREETQPQKTVQTISQSWNRSCSISTTSIYLYNSFLSRAMRDREIWPTDDHYNWKTQLDGYLYPLSLYIYITWMLEWIIVHFLSISKIWGTPLATSRWSSVISSLM